MQKILQKRLGYHFKESQLLEQALTHRSVVGAENNERLEFLGDAILGHIVAEALFQKHRDAREGELSRMRSSLVCGEHLADIAKQLALGDALKLGAGEKKSGGVHRQSILADALEAVIGAIYLDGGMACCCDVVLQLYGGDIEVFSNATPEKDPKTELQEWLQARKLPLPIYEATVTGEAHAQTFHVVCRVEGLAYQAEGSSTNRRKAERAAAKVFLELLYEK